LLIVAAFKVLVEGSRGVEIDPVSAVDPHNQQMLLVGHAGLLVVDDLTIAIEREAVFGVAADAEDGNSLIGGSNGWRGWSASGRAE
jgi:hypothetical protein